MIPSLGMDEDTNYLREDQSIYSFTFENSFKECVLWALISQKSWDRGYEMESSWTCPVLRTLVN